jgi:hypothetical protein
VKEKKQIEVSKKTDTQIFFELLSKGDGNMSKADIQQLQELLTRTPTLSYYPQNFSEAMLDKALESSGLSEVFRVITKAQLTEMKKELGYAAAPKVEKLVIDQIAICWIHLCTLQGLYHKRTNGEHTREHGIYWEQRLDFAERRYMKALSTLSKMRKLNINIQMNAAEKQVIVNQGEPSPKSQGKD